MTSLEARRLRCDQVNAVIRIIASHGRRFFHHKGTTARMVVADNGRIWFVDDYSGKAIYTHTSPCARWRGFSHGGTLRALVVQFRDYIRLGHELHPGWLGHYRDDGSNVWGYEPEAMAAVRAEAWPSPVFNQEDRPCLTNA